MHPEAYLAEARKKDRDELERDHDLFLILNYLEVAERLVNENHVDGYPDVLDATTMSHNDSSWEVISRYASHAGEWPAGELALMGLENFTGRVNEELRTRELLDQHQ